MLNAKIIFGSDVDFCTACQNVNHCNQQNYTHFDFHSQPTHNF